MLKTVNSDEGPVRIWDHSPRFDSVSRALAAFANDPDAYESEYGLTMDPAVRDRPTESIYWYESGAFFIVSSDYTYFNDDEYDEGNTVMFKSGVTFLAKDGKALEPISPKRPESYFVSDLTFMGYTL